MLRLLSSVLMGWALGSNDSANIFGTAVYSKTIRFRTAVTLLSLFVILGALSEGQHGMHTLSSLVQQTANSAFVASLSAAITVTIMSFLKLPVSTSQATVGAILGIGAHVGNMDLSQLVKVLIAWVSTPIGTIVVSVLLYPIIGRILDRLPITIFTRDRFLKFAVVAVGSYGAYSLGANNVANVTGVYTQIGLIGVTEAALLGGVSIALGAITYSRNVMMTVGKKLVRLDPFSAFITVLAEAVVLHFFAVIGVPVSASQAIIGAVIGIGLLKGVQTINSRTLFNIVFGWIGTPAVAFLLAAAGYFVIR